MSATIIDGKAIAADLRAAVKAATAQLHAAHGLVPALAVVLIGDAVLLVLVVVLFWVQPM